MQGAALWHPPHGPGRAGDAGHGRKGGEIPGRRRMRTMNWNAMRVKGQQRKPRLKAVERRRRKLERRLKRNQFIARADFYLSDAWLKVRYRALKRSQGCCQCCGSRAAKNKPLHVDHIKPRSKFPELSLELSNLQVLCFDCNMGKSNVDDTDWRRR